MIKAVLTTDLAKHNDDLIVLKQKILDGCFDKEIISEPDKLFLMGISVHCADIFLPSKKWHQFEKWTYLLIDEFFKQADEDVQ